MEDSNPPVTAWYEVPPPIDEPVTQQPKKGPTYSYPLANNDIEAQKAVNIQRLDAHPSIIMGPVMCHNPKGNTVRFNISGTNGCDLFAVEICVKKNEFALIFF